MTSIRLKWDYETEKQVNLVGQDIEINPPVMQFQSKTMITDTLRLNLEYIKVCASVLGKSNVDFMYRDELSPLCCKINNDAVVIVAMRL